MSEKQLQTKIINAINANGIAYVWNVNAGKLSQTDRFGRRRLVNLAPKGHSDIQGIRNDGRFVAIEVKMPDRRKLVTPPQRAFLKGIEELGGIAGVASSVEEALSIILETERVRSR